MGIVLDLSWYNMQKVMELWLCELADGLQMQRDPPLVLLLLISIIIEVHRCTVRLHDCAYLGQIFTVYLSILVLIDMSYIRS